MSYAHINGAQIYYDLFGEARPGRVPILLIHGAAGTGLSDWSEVAPLLARHYPIIVPDCRGHGRSTNPDRSYSFHEIAADLSELILRLGYQRVHLVGHGYGANVALVMLLEYAEVVQTCTLQAANAYAAPDLVEAPGSLWDPDRVACESPGRMQELIALHGPMHGRDYWKDLLRLIQAETASQPTYTEQDLALARRPVLVIQGAQDGVNGPTQCGPYLAQHIPEAEWWFPEGLGHKVHKADPWLWIQRLLDFLARRGDPANDALDRLLQRDYADPRETIFALHADWIEPEAEPSAAPQGVAAESAVADDTVAQSASMPSESINQSAGNGDDDEPECWPVELPQIRLTGRVLDNSQIDAVMAALDAAPLAISGLTTAAEVLLSPTTPWAFIDCSAADLRAAPSVQAERVSQVLLGEPLRVLEESECWAHVRLEQDGYLGWIESALLSPWDQETARAYQDCANLLVIAELATLYEKPSRTSARQGKVPFGLALPAAAHRTGWIDVVLPGDRRGWIPAGDLLPTAERPRPDREGIKQALDLMLRFTGVPYLWGGRSAFGFDGSGLTQTFLRLMNIAAPRDADQQFRAGIPVDGVPQPGDLVFFGHDAPRDDSRKITRYNNISHVAISLGGYEILQSGGGALSVNCLCLDPPTGPAAQWLRDHIAGIRRFGDTGT